MSREMKDSGVEWIGEIPADWDICKIDSLYFPRSTKVSDKDYPPLSVTMKGIVPQLATTAKTDDHDNRKLVKKGDFAINSRSDRRGSCGISEYDGSVSLINTVLQPRHGMNNEYYNWLFHSDMFSSEFYRLGHGIVDDLRTTSWQEMKKMVIPAPSPTEQQQIVHFLDRKCTAIDTAIEKTKESIEKLEEYKKAVITKAVTKGLDPDAKMKDSGIEWIGEVPETWDVKRIKYACLERKEKKIFKDAPNRYIGLENVESYTGHFIETESTYLPGVYDVCYENDILFGKLRPYLAKVIMAPYEAACTGEFLIIKNFVGEIKFLFYWLANKEFVKAVDVSTYGAKMPRANTEFIMNLPICLPSDKEQQQILSYLDDKCASIDVLISKKQDAINKWEEYKKSLIYYAVTGKIDCRNEAVK